MASPTRHELLGCLIGALDDAERRRVEEAVQRNPGLQQEMARLAEQAGPLLAMRQSVEPPPGLAARTCRAVALSAWAAGAALRGAVSRATRGMSPAKAPPSGVAGWAWPDLIVSACIVACAALLVFPALYSNRLQSQLNNCRRNLYQAWNAASQVGASYGRDGHAAAAAVERSGVAARWFPADPSVYSRILQRQADAASGDRDYLVQVSGHVSPMATTPERAPGSQVLYRDGGAAFVPDVSLAPPSAYRIRSYSSPEALPER
jgi:hypothetical protein